MQGEQWRVSVPSEWMPFLTLLSKCPCVNTADQMAERETGRERQKQRCCWRVESGAEGLPYILTAIPVCLSVCQSVWPCVSFSLKLLRPHFYMQQANGSVAMVTTERPRIFQSIKKSGGSAPPPPTSHIHSFKWIVNQALGGTGDGRGNTYAYYT